MGKKKKTPPDDLSKLVDKLVEDVNADRDVVVNFMKQMIAEYTPDHYVGIAEYVAKLADAATRQNQVKAAAVKALSKNQNVGEQETDMDEIHEEIGLPFEDEFDEGSN